LLLLAVYALLQVVPAGRIDKLQAQVREQRASLAWMQQAALDVDRLRPRVRPTGEAGQSLLARAERAVRRAGLGTASAGIEPHGENQVRIVLEQAPFEALARWLHALAEHDGLEAERVAIERGGRPGIVNARITLGDMGP
jgi:type II secretory pathway component PulM